MKKQFILALTSLAVASSASAILPGGGKRAGSGGTEKKVEELLGGKPGEKASASGKSHAETEHAQRISNIKSKLKIEGNGLENLIRDEAVVDTEVKIESTTNKGEQVGTATIKVNTKEFTLDLLSKVEAIERGTMKVTPVQKAGYEALLKFLSFSGSISLVDGPGESGVAAQTSEALKFVRVMKNTIEVKDPDTTEQDIQSYINIADNATKGLKPGETMPIHKTYKRIGKDPMERNANCLERM